MRCDCCEADLDDWETNELEAEIKDRYRRKGVGWWISPGDDLRNVQELLGRGEIERAKAILDSLIRPKWESRLDCKKAYEIAKHGKPIPPPKVYPAYKDSFAVLASIA